MEIQLKKNSTTPLYKQIRNTIRSQILSGQLSDGFKLPLGAPAGGKAGCPPQYC